MPGIYLPTTTNYPDGVVRVRSLDGTSYNQIIGSLGSTLYAIDKVYIKGSSNEQVMVPIQYQKYDVNGNIKTFQEIANIDPNQFQASLYIDMQKHKLVFDGTLSAKVPLLPLETCFLYFYVLQA